MTVYLGKNPVGVGRIVEKKVAKTKLGASIDNFIGDVDADGVLQAVTDSIEIKSSGIKSIGDNALNNTFYNNKNIVSADLSSVQTIGDSGLSYTFYSCTNLISVVVSSLQSVGAYALTGAFYGCTKLTTMSFPSLISVQTNSFSSNTANNAFRLCSGLKEIHFRADMQATIETMTGYETKWGATNATIYFDL